MEERDEGQLEDGTSEAASPSSSSAGGDEAQEVGIIPLRVASGRNAPDRIDVSMPSRSRKGAAMESLL